MGVHTFPKGICPKVNVIARLEYELAYYDSTVHRFNHYTTRTLMSKQVSSDYVCHAQCLLDFLIISNLFRTSNPYGLFHAKFSQCYKRKRKI